MIVTINNETGEKVSKEQIRSIVINEGRWEGRSLEFDRSTIFDLIIEKVGDEYNAKVEVLGISYQARGFIKFDSAFTALEKLETFALQAL